MSRQVGEISAFRTRQIVGPRPSMTMRQIPVRALQQRRTGHTRVPPTLQVAATTVVVPHPGVRPDRHEAKQQRAARKAGRVRAGQERRARKQIRRWARRLKRSPRQLMAFAAAVEREVFDA